MKTKYFLFAILGALFVGGANAMDITIYHSPTCPHCHHARAFLSSTLIYEYPNLTITEVDVSQHTPLFRETVKKCGYERGGVPVIVIGEKCFQGYAEFMNNELRSYVESDMSDKDKAIAAENKKLLEENAEEFKSSHADRKNAIVEYKPGMDLQKKNKVGVLSHKSMYFYIVLALVVLGLVGLFIKRKK